MTPRRVSVRNCPEIIRACAARQFLSHAVSGKERYCRKAQEMSGNIMTVPKSGSRSKSGCREEEAYAISNPDPGREDTKKRGRRE